MRAARPVISALTLTLTLGAASCSTGGGLTASSTTAATSTAAGGTTISQPAPTATGPATAGPTTIPTTTVPPAPTTTLAAADPARLAGQLTAAERTVRDANASPDAIETAGRTAQQAYRLLAIHPEWQAAVLAGIDADVKPAVVNNLAAVNALASGKHSPPADTLPPWRIVVPRPAAELLAYYHDAEKRTGVPWYYLAAINLVETRMGRIEGVSTAGAQGPMQFLPSTWAACCQGDIHNPHDAIVGAAVYLQHNGAPGAIDRAIFRYNNDDRYVAAVKAYAANMQANERAYFGYHAWEVYFLTSAGSFRLPVGYVESAPIPVTDYMATTGARPA